MTIAYAETLRDNQLDEIAALAGNAALLRIYNGSRPATGGAATTLLAELTCGSPFAGAASGGVLTANAVASDESADATGTATWFRIVASPDDTLAAAGASAAPVFTGDMAAIESPDTLAATGEVSSDAIVGTVAVTEATDTLAAAGTFTVGPTTGAVSVTEETDLLAAAGTSTTPVFTGTLATTEAAGVLAAAGTFSPGSRQGTGVYSEAADTLAAVGTFTPVPTATGSVSMLPGRASMATTLATRYATAVLAVSRVPTSGGVT